MKISKNYLNVFSTPTFIHSYFRKCLINQENVSVLLSFSFTLTDLLMNI